MTLVQETLPSLSQYFAGLLLASLVVFAVLLIGLIVFRKSSPFSNKATKQDEPDAATKDASSDAPEPEETGEVVSLRTEDEDPAERAERFQKLAIAALETGRLGEAKDLFEKTLAVSADHELAPLRARAYYELGNLAKAQADIQGACENWQSARHLYEELGDKKKMRELDSVMATENCPSEWVMNSL